MFSRSQLYQMCVWGIYSSYQAESRAVEVDGAGDMGGCPSISSRGEQIPLEGSCSC